MFLRPISGGDSVVQLQSEIRCLSLEERQEVLKGANLPVVIPPEHVLAMKSDLSPGHRSLRYEKLQGINIHFNLFSFDSTCKQVDENTKHQFGK